MTDKTTQPDDADAEEAAVDATPEAVASEPVADAPTPEQKAAAQKSEARAQRSSGAVESRPTKAIAKYLRFSAQKGRLVVDQIRGKTVADAEVLLAFSTRAASREVLKVLKSATANAVNNFHMDREELYVAAAFADEGPTSKRWKPRARGRVDRINKRTCHVTVIVDTAPAELLEGRRGSSSRSSGSRSARVAASKATSDAAKGPSKKPAAAKKPAAKKPSATKPAAKKAGDS